MHGGPISFNGRSDLLELSEREMRAIRGAEIGFIFQEPMTALNPVYTIGDQIAEALLVHGESHASPGARQSRSSCSRPCRSPIRRAGCATIPISCPAACASVC